MCLKSHKFCLANKNLLKLQLKIPGIMIFVQKIVKLVKLFPIKKYKSAQTLQVLHLRHYGIDIQYEPNASWFGHHESCMLQV